MILAILWCSFPRPVNADEIRMMIWHPKIDPHNLEMMDDIEAFMGYLNGRLKSDNITYAIVQTPQEALDYFDSYNPKIGFIDRRYWKKYASSFSPGFTWLRVSYLKKPLPPPDLFVGSEELLPDLVGEVLLHGARFKRELNRRERVDILRAMGIQTPKKLNSPFLGGNDEGMDDIAKIISGLYGIPGISPIKRRAPWSVLVQFSSDIPEGITLKESLLMMDQDPVGRDILESLRIERFKSR